MERQQSNDALKIISENARAKRSFNNRLIPNNKRQTAIIFFEKDATIKIMRFLCKQANEDRTTSSKCHASKISVWIFFLEN